MDSFSALFVFILGCLAIPVGLLAVGTIIGPKRNAAVKSMPYESGMDPLHDTRRRYDVRFHLVAVAFLLFDVELLFIYPWAVASLNEMGIDRAVADGLVSSRWLVFAGVLSFLGLLTAGLIYEWKKGVLQWR